MMASTPRQMDTKWGLEKVMGVRLSLLRCFGASRFGEVFTAAFFVPNQWQLDVWHGRRKQLSKDAEAKAGGRCASD
jgi:hypothetical protein